MSSCCCSTSLLIIVLVAHSLAQTPTESSSDSIHDVPLNNGSNGAEHGEPENSSSMPHCRPVNNNFQIHGCNCQGDSSTAVTAIKSLTGTILAILQNQEQRFTPRPAPNMVSGNPRDCAEIQASGVNTSGVYPIYPDGAGNPFFVSCDMETDGGGWTVFQRRQDGSVDFFLEWADYKYGFGSVSSEHWLGNDNIHRLAIQKAYELRVDLEDFTGQVRYANYSTFYVADEEAKYTMTLGEYSGDAVDSLSHHSGRQFTTKDRDNDDDINRNCASTYNGAWWYVNCHHSNLNGLYLHGTNSEHAKGIVWFHWLGTGYSLKKTEMKIRPL